MCAHDEMSITCNSSKKPFAAAGREFKFLYWHTSLFTPIKSDGLGSWFAAPPLSSPMISISGD